MSDTKPYSVYSFMSLVILLMTVACGANQSEKVTPSQDALSAGQRCPKTPFVSSEELITYLYTPEVGCVALKIWVPAVSRYDEGAPIVVQTPTSFTPSAYKDGFDEGLNATSLGAVNIAFLLPGECNGSTCTDGAVDHGGADSLAVFRDVIRFASGRKRNARGALISRLVPSSLTSNVGVYAFSHPGILVTNTLAKYGTKLRGLDYFVGRENPSQDIMSTVELGDVTNEVNAYTNPIYDYATDYSSDAISLDYSSINWLQDTDYPDGVAFFDFNNNGAFEAGRDYVLADRQPSGFGLRLYSEQLTTALSARYLRGEIEAFNSSGWPTDLATATDAVNFWIERSSIGEGYNHFVDAAAAHPNLKVMLVFSENDHVQFAEDKPHIHHAYDGFANLGGLWARMNPDRAYVEWAYQNVGINIALSKIPDQAANTEPSDWGDIGNYAYPSSLRSANSFVPLAAVAEMMDRTQTNVWGSGKDNLRGTLLSTDAPSL